MQKKLHVSFYTKLNEKIIIPKNNQLALMEMYKVDHKKNL